MTFDVNAIASAIASTAADANKSQAGGGDYVPPAAGPCNLRFIGYVETGKHTRTIKGVPKTENQVELVFELSGPKHQPKETENGEKIPHRIKITLNHSLNEKAKYFKLFKKMNYEGKATHFSQLLGGAFIGRVVHDKWKDKEGKERITAKLEDKELGITVAPPRRTITDPETFEETVVPVKVDPAISPIRLFVWNAPEQMLKQLWDSLYIEKRGDGDRDPNVFQKRIKEADNFVGSPIEALLKANGEVADIPAATAAADLGLDEDDGLDGQPDSDDPLAGM